MGRVDIHCFVGFTADFPDEAPEDEPAGRELAAFIATTLEKGGFTDTEPSSSDYAWELAPTREGVRARTLVGHVGDMGSDPPRQWLITNDVAVGLIERVLSRDAAPRKERVLRTLVSTLHETLSADPRFSNVWWYKPSTFDGPGDQPRQVPDP